MSPSLGVRPRVRYAISFMTATRPSRGVAMTPFRRFQTMSRKKPSGTTLRPSRGGSAVIRARALAWRAGRLAFADMSDDNIVTGTTWQRLCPPYLACKSLKTTIFVDSQAAKWSPRLQICVRLQRLPLVHQISHFPHQGLVAIDDRPGLVAIVVEAGGR